MEKLKEMFISWKNSKPLKLQLNSVFSLLFVQLLYFPLILFHLIVAMAKQYHST